MNTSSSTGRLSMPQITDGWNKKVYFMFNFSVLCNLSHLERSLVFRGPSAVIQRSCTYILGALVHDTCVCLQAFCGDPQQLHRV